MNIWRKMIDRCEKETSKSKYYKDKGIAVCDAWKAFSNFEKWAHENGYKDTLTIDRLDNSKGYSPENCRWATYLEQAQNTSANVWVTINGESHLVNDWCKILGIVSRATVYRRIKDYGWDYEKALTTPHLNTWKARNGEYARKNKSTSVQP